MKQTLLLLLLSTTLSTIFAGCTSDPIRRTYGEPVSANPYADASGQDTEQLDVTPQDTNSPDAAPDTPTPNDVGPDAAEEVGVDVEEDTANVDGTQIKIATFNVRRFFDTVCDSGSCDDGDFEEVLSQEEFNARADELTAAIQAINPDIINLQEIESQENLNALQDRLGNAYSAAIHGETFFDASLDVAVLGKGDLLTSTRHREDPIPDPTGGTTTFTREFLEVHINIRNTRVVVFSAHFKSKSNDDPNRRLAEAQAARTLVLDAQQRHPDALVVLGGDLNDTPDSPPLNALEEGDSLFRVTSTLAPQDWTATFSGNTIAIDHLYLAVDGAGSLVPDSAVIHREGRGGWGGSDHAAVSADFVIPNE